MREEGKYLIKKLTMNCKILGVGVRSPALLHGKYTACRAEYIGVERWSEGRGQSLRGRREKNRTKKK